MKESYSILNIETKSHETAKIRLTSPPWDDIMYSYSTVGFEDSEIVDAPGILKFEYHVNDPVDFNIENYSKEEQIEFETLLGDILVDIIQGVMDSEKNK
jgi:hypothetical protein|tara:strand:- start:1260 stop:1556 length:297 start_codon:yes stop_codon:yes gene_type:complete